MAAKIAPKVFPTLFFRRKKIIFFACTVYGKNTLRILYRKSRIFSSKRVNLVSKRISDIDGFLIT